MLCMYDKDVSVDFIDGYPSLEYPNGSTYCYHDFYEIELYFSGSGTHYINTVPYNVNKGYFFLLFPGDYHCYSLKSEERLIMYNLKFTGKISNKMIISEIANFTRPYSVYLSDEDLEAVKYEIILLNRLLISDRYNHDYINNIVERICIIMKNNLNKYKTHENINDRYTPFNNVIEYINENYNQKITSVDMAQKLNLSENYFGVYFKNHTGMCLNEYINRVRLYHASLMLNSTNLSIKEISHTTGYNSPEYFARCFIKSYGISPLKFRFNMNQTKK